MYPLLPLRLIHCLRVIDPGKGTVRDRNIQEPAQGLPAILDLKHQELVCRHMPLDLLHMFLVELYCSVLACRHCREHTQPCRGGAGHRVREVPDELGLTPGPHQVVEDVAREGLLGDGKVQDGIPDTLVPLDRVPHIEEHLGLGVNLQDLLVKVRHRIVNTSNIISQDCLPSISK